MSAILLDTCVWGGTLSALIELGHDTVWTGSWDQDPGDRIILEKACQDHRILVTLDKDFGELAVFQGLPHHGIIRLTGFRVSQIAKIIDYLVKNYQQDLTQGAIITANPDRIRIRKSG
jgi:predicted nuclease of predicted toxin-antitoxin system